MASKEFISARIPRDLLEKIENYAEAKGESKSKILIEAIKKYLEPEESSTEEKLSLEKREERIKHFERWIDYRLENLEKRVLSLEQIEKFLSELEKEELVPVLSQKDDCKYLPPSSTESDKKLIKDALRQVEGEIEV